MTGATRSEIRVTELSEPISHYTDAVKFGDVLHISGIAPLDSSGKLVGADDPAEQTRQIFRNMSLILKQANATFADILKVTVYLTNIEDRVRINPVRQEYFGAARPASTLIGVAALAVPGMRVEIEAVVGLKNQS